MSFGYPDMFPLNNCPPEIPPRTITFQTFVPRTSTLNNFPLEDNPRKIADCEISPRTIIFTPDNYNRRPWNSFKNKWQRTSALNNYPWVIYKWHLKKALFTHSDLEILNKSWKELSKELCIPLRGNILPRGNPFYKWMELGFI